MAVSTLVSALIDPSANARSVSPPLSITMPPTPKAFASSTSTAGHPVSNRGNSTPTASYHAPNDGFFPTPLSSVNAPPLLQTRPLTASMSRSAIPHHSAPSAAGAAISASSPSSGSASANANAATATATVRVFQQARHATAQTSAAAASQSTAYALRVAPSMPAPPQRKH
jgi:hypothetical protein